MADVLFYPPIPNRPLLFEQLFRSVWHFLPAVGKIDKLHFVYGGDDFALIDVEQVLAMAKLYLNRDFDPAIADYAPRFSGKVALSAERTLNPGAYTKDRFPDLKGILVWHVGDAEAVAAARQIAEQTGAEIIWTDPAAVQQETLQTIRFAYKFFAQEEM